jgi:hypothetical protein
MLLRVQRRHARVVLRGGLLTGARCRGAARLTLVRRHHGQHGVRARRGPLRRGHYLLKLRVAPGRYRARVVVRSSCGERAATRGFRVP